MVAGAPLSIANGDTIVLSVNMAKRQLVARKSTASKWTVKMVGMRMGTCVQPHLSPLTPPLSPISQRIPGSASTCWPFACLYRSGNELTFTPV